MLRAIARVTVRLYTGGCINWYKYFKSGIEIINVAASWINSRPESLNTLFPFIVNSLSMRAKNCKEATDIAPSISSTAAYVLGNICRICADSMPSEVLSVYESIGQHGLKLKDEVFVIEGMSSIVSKLPPAEASKRFGEVVEPNGYRSTCCHRQE